MNDKQIDELINQVLHTNSCLPEGLSGRLEQQIDSWAAAEEKKARSSPQKQLLFRISGVAAAVLLCIGIFQIQSSFHNANQMADTYTNPEEAAVAAQKALLFMSQNLNKGIDQARDARQEINKINNILNKHIKD